MGEVEEFVARWGLDQTSLQLLVGLSPDVRARVLKDFRPTEDTQNVNGRLRGFVKSVSSTDEAARQVGAAAAVDSVTAFAQSWGLQEDSAALLRGLQPDILTRVMREFRPNGETLNMDGRLRAFVRSVSSSVLQVDPVLQFAQKWGLDEESVQFLQALPADVLQRVLVGFTPKADTTNVGGRLRAFARSVAAAVWSTAGAPATPRRGGLGAALNTEAPGVVGMGMPISPAGPQDAYAAFAAMWGLDEDSLLLLRRLPEAVASRVVDEFVPLGGLESVNQQFQAFAMTALTTASPAAAPTAAPSSVPEFLQHWGLGPEAAAFLEALPPEHLHIVLRDFRPAGDTKNVLGRLMGFARNIGKPTAGHLTSPLNSLNLAPAAAPPQRVDEFGAFAAAWGLDPETVRFLQGLPADVLLRVTREFTPNQDTRNVGARLRAFARSIAQSAAPAPLPLQDPVQQFVEFGL